MTLFERQRTFTKEGLVTNGNFFTRETWRAGNRSKLRKRVQWLCRMQDGSSCVSRGG